MNSLLVDRKIKPVGQANLGLPKGSFWNRPPLRTLCVMGLLFEVLFIQLPIRSILYILAPKLTRPNPKWNLQRNLLTSLFRHWTYYIVQIGVASGVVDKTSLPTIPVKQGATAVWIPPIHYQTELTGEMKSLFEDGGCTVSRIPSYWYGEDHLGKSGRHAKKDEKVIIYFHGGGYRSLNALPSSPAFNNLRIVLDAAKKSGKLGVPKRALSVEYRLTSEGHTFPSIFVDALAAWIYLVRECQFEPKNIIFLGDSAGGNLALALLRYIRDERPLQLSNDSPIANSLILSSPWIDLSASICLAGPSSSGELNAKYDYINAYALGMAKTDLVKGLPVPFQYSPWISPVTLQRNLQENVFEKFPKAYCVFGELELFSDEIKAFAQHYQFAHDQLNTGPLTLHEEPNAVHDFPAIPFTYQIEKIHVRDSIAKWFKEQ